MKTFSLILLLAGTTVVSAAQEYALGLFGGFNFTLLGLTSKQTVNQELRMDMWFGANAGCINRWRIHDRHIVDLLAVYSMRNTRDNNRIDLRDSTNHLTGRYEKKTVINHYIGFAPVYAYQLTDLIALGTGFHLRYLIASHTRLKDVNDKMVSLPNHQFRQWHLSLPVVLSYELDNIHIRLQFDKGLTSRVDGVIRERENTFSVEVGYFFLRRGSKQ